MEYLVNAKQMKQCDRDTIEQIGIPSMVLMERAALAVTEELFREKLNLSRVLVVCGSGNNGGDGFAVARLLAERGVQVDCIFVGREASMTPECRMQRQICENCGMKIGSNPASVEYTVIVDAIFGIGLTRKVEGAYGELIRYLNGLDAVRIAVDIPSGIHADTGAVMGTAFRADLTVTFAAKKIGQILYPGTRFCGKLVCRDIGIRTADTAVFTYEQKDLQRIARRSPYSNKGSYGRVLLIAGSEGMSGAACLAARAAYRSGCGLVRVFTPECNRQVVQTLLPEAIVTAYREETQAMEQLKEALAWADVVGIGPGIGTGALAERFLRMVLSDCRKPVVADADALNLMAGCPAEFLKPETDPEKRRKNVIVTPHIGEMTRLAALTKEAVLADLPGVCRGFAEKYGIICVLKDARTVVSDGEALYLNTSGNSGMAAGGSGDVLTGIICGLLAQGMPCFDAATLGVYLHGLAGDAAARKYGEYAMLSGEIAEQIGAVLQENSRTGMEEGRKYGNGQ